VRLTSLVGTDATARVAAAAPGAAHPERCVEAYYLQRTRFENIAERKLRRRQLTKDGNVEMTVGICVKWQKPTFTGFRQTAVVEP
jgi:hypothetical protein